MKKKKNFLDQTHPTTIRIPPAKAESKGINPTTRLMRLEPATTPDGTTATLSSYRNIQVNMVMSRILFFSHQTKVRRGRSETTTRGHHHHGQTDTK